MRKPSEHHLRRIVQGALALLVVSACDRAESPKVAYDQTMATAAPAVGSAASSVANESVASSDGFAARDEAREAKLMARSRSAVSPPTAVPAADVAAQGRVGGSAAARADLALGTPIPAIDPMGAMLVRHGQATLEVKTVDDAVAKMRQTASQFGGFVANTALRTGKDEQRSATLQLRIPSAQFDGAVAALSQLGRVESVSVTAEDVAEEYVDLGARLTNARRVEARLVEMLASRTGKLSDVLTVEQELARVRMEAERYEARMRWLERRASLSSLDVSIHEKLPFIDSPRGPSPILVAFGEAWERMVGFVAWFIASLGVLIPLGVIVGAGVLVARRVLRWNGVPGTRRSGTAESASSAG